MTDAAAEKTAHFLDLMNQAREAGKTWWVDLQFKQIEECLLQDKIIQALTHALEIVRDADNDCKSAGGHPLPIPPLVRATIDEALELAAPPFVGGSDSAAKEACPYCPRKIYTARSLRQHIGDAHPERKGV